MTQNLIIGGVGGQGILSVAAVICDAALAEGLNVRQSEVHGMSQRGGAVQSHLRLARGRIASDLIPKGECDLILAVEPVEALRYFEFLKPEGTVITSLTKVENIPNYPDLSQVWKDLLGARHIIPIDSDHLARHSGSGLAQGMVMLGGASPFLKLKVEHLEKSIQSVWARKGEKVVKTNLDAFRLGRKMAAFLMTALESGAPRETLRELAEKVPPKALGTSDGRTWKTFLA